MKEILKNVYENTKGSTSVLVYAVAFVALAEMVSHPKKDLVLDRLEHVRVRSISLPAFSLLTHTHHR